MAETGESRGCLVTQAVSALEMLILYDNNDVTEFVVRALETLAVDYVFDGPVVQSQVPALRVPALEKAKENERDACLSAGSSATRVRWRPNRRSSMSRTF